MLPQLHSQSDNRPRFEYYPDGGGRLRSVLVEQTPFIIGRGENSGLEINSTSVSRDHAQLERTAGGYCLRDLGSTNGTWINGAKIASQTLHDGDAVRIADVELTFVCSSLGRLQSMVTQPLAANAPPAEAGSTSARVNAARSLGEALLRLAIPLRRRPIYDLRYGALLAVRVGIDEPLAAQLAGFDSPDPNSVASRVQDVAWQLAAQHATEEQSDACTLLQVERRSRLEGRRLAAFRDAVQTCRAPGALGISVPWEWVNDSPAALTTCERLRGLGARLAYEGFAGGARCVESLAPAAPDYLTLAPEVVRDVATNKRRWQRLEIVQASCEAAAVRLVLPTQISNEDSQACQALGIDCGESGRQQRPSPAAARREEAAL